MLFSNEIHLLILRNRVFRLRNVEIWHAVQQRVRFGDAEESRIQAENRSDGKCCPARCLIADAQESLIQVAKRSNVGIAVVKGLRFADTQELRFEAWKRSHMGCYACYMFDLLILRNCVFRLVNVQIWIQPSS